MSAFRESSLLQGGFEVRYPKGLERSPVQRNVFEVRHFPFLSPVPSASDERRATPSPADVITDDFPLNKQHFVTAVFTATKVMMHLSYRFDFTSCQIAYL